MFPQDKDWWPDSLFKFYSQFYKHITGTGTHNNTLEKELRIFPLASMNPNVSSTKILVSCSFVLRGRCLVPSFDGRSGVYIEIVPN